MRNYISEVFGTFAIVFFGTGVVIVNQETHGVVGHTGICIVWGLIVMSMIYALGTVSGAHFNPAVSIGFAIAKKFEWAQVVPYIISQCVGAIAGSAVLKLLFPANEMLGGTMPAGSDVQSFVLEFILTFVLMAVIMRVAFGSKEQGLFAGLAISSIVCLEALMAGPVSGASMNPARSLGPALVSMHMNKWWIYAIAPTLGSIAAVYFDMYLGPAGKVEGE
ncbi:MAG: aquaporin [Bacteroidetes bacterium]|nr:aquaporin [Bacteroidota bacterium]